MARMLVPHKVRRYRGWRRAYKAFDVEHKGLRVKRHAVFRAVSKPNDVTVRHDSASVTEAMAFVRSRRLRGVMKDAGVRSAPAICFVEATWRDFAAEPGFFIASKINRPLRRFNSLFFFSESRA